MEAPACTDRLSRLNAARPQAGRGSHSVSAKQEGKSYLYYNNIATMSK